MHSLRIRNQPSASGEATNTMSSVDPCNKIWALRSTPEFILAVVKIWIFYQLIALYFFLINTTFFWQEHFCLILGPLLRVTIYNLISLEYHYHYRSQNQKPSLQSPLTSTSRSAKKAPKTPCRAKPQKTSRIAMLIMRLHLL
jgi:hypothetical protein